MFKDILERDGDNPFDVLARRWRWNLYLIKQKTLKQEEIHGTLETIAKKSYEKFVHEPFELPEPQVPTADVKVRLEAPIDIIPPAWQLETLKQQSLIPAH
jgi:hypothetical protein